MIELNLSYEQSKKILELGYDFSRLCPIFQVEILVKIALGGSFTEFILNQDVVETLEDEFLGKKTVRPRSDYRQSLLNKNPYFDRPFKEIIPIIPKAALEACLPEIKLSPVSEPHFQKYDVSNDEIELWEDRGAYEEDITHEPFKSAYEAFIWCHENYPEELKKKFEEERK